MREFIFAAIGGALVALGGYFLIVKENQINIDHLTEAVSKLESTIGSEINELKVIGIQNQNKLIATKLVIAQAHPDRDISTLASSRKLGPLLRKDIEILARSLRKVVIVGGEIDSSKFDPELLTLIDTHKFSTDDVVAYAYIAGDGEKFTFKFNF